MADTVGKLERGKQAAEEGSHLVALNAAHYYAALPGRRLPHQPCSPRAAFQASRPLFAALMGRLSAIGWEGVHPHAWGPWAVAGCMLMLSYAAR